MAKILVTGGCGYIGSHTVADLLQNGFEVVSIDNLSRSYESSLDGVKEITGKSVKNYQVDLCDWSALEKVFQQEGDIDGIIHFAAFKTVPESVEKPVMYYHNNLSSTINILRAVKEFGIKQFVFSSSCSVYGNAKELPITEETPIQNAECPYAWTKIMGEQMVQDFVAAYSVNAILLRYFNPVGAHTSGIIGEEPINPPNSLVPRITATASGIYESLSVFGGDYDTRDGTCVRDYIHVMDIADAHTKALQFASANNKEKMCEVFNLGTGNGVTVLEAINAFEKVSGQPLNHGVVARRDGDVIACYADNQKAKTALGWVPQYGINEMMSTAWQWQQKLSSK